MTESSRISVQVAEPAWDVPVINGGGMAGEECSSTTGATRRIDWVNCSGRLGGENLVNCSGAARLAAQSAQLAPIILRLSFCGQLRYRRHQIQRAARESIRARNRRAIPNLGGAIMEQGSAACA